MTDHTDAADERHEQGPESVPAPDLRLPPATVDPEQRGDRAVEATGPDGVPLAGLGPYSAREPVMSTANGHRSADHATVTGTRPVVLLRYRPGTIGQTARVVHLVPLPPEGQAGAAGVALCGALLCPDLVETVTPGHSMPCTPCMINQPGAPPTSATVPPGEDVSSETDPLVAAVCYQAWDWPVTLRGHQVWLTLEPDTVALIIPVLLAAQVTGILTQRRCPPLTLIHPETPEHWVLLAGQHPEVALPWPTWVHRTTTTLPLPPTMTPPRAAHLGAPTRSGRTPPVLGVRGVRGTAHRATRPTHLKS